MVPLTGPGGKIKGWLDLYSFPLRDELTGKVTGIIEYIRDITERKIAEKKLKEREEAYSLVTKETGQLIYDYNIRTGDITWGGAIQEVTGFSPAEFVVNIKEWERRIHPDDTAFAIKLLAEALKKGQRYLAEYRFQVKGGKFRDIKNTGVFLKDKRGKSFRMLGTLTDITEHKQADRVKQAVYKISEAVNASVTIEELFRSIHHTIIELMPAKNFYIALHDRALEMLSFPYWIDEYDETPAPHKLGRGLTEYVLHTGEPLLASPEKFEELVQSGEVESIGAPSIDWLGVPLKTKDKTIGVLVIQTYTEGVRYHEEDKNMLMFVSAQAAMAIERKRAEKALLESLKEKEVLLKEIHHRVKNNMQVISSLLNLQSKYLQDPKALEMFKDSQNRIRSMALVHEKLYQSKDLSRIDFAEYIQNFVGYLFRSYQVDATLIQLQMKLQASSMDINLAIPCGLIVNELVSNSLKHAFPEEKAGEVAVEFKQCGDHKYILTIRDNGVGFPETLDFDRTETFGLQVVKTLVNQIDGTIQLARTGGTKFTIEFRELSYKPRV
jgi:PAS domain S-box-containing protein